MIIVIRISGHVNMPSRVEEMLFRIRLRRKYAAVLIKNKLENIKLLKRIRNYVAYGSINLETVRELIKARGIAKMKKKKLDIDKVIEQIEKRDVKNWEIKPFFRLHPPRGGIDSKIHFGKGKGVLGDNKEKINELVRRML